jgi:hypothetical protein
MYCRFESSPGREFCFPLNRCLDLILSHDVGRGESLALTIKYKCRKLDLEVIDLPLGRSKWALLFQLGWGAICPKTSLLSSPPTWSSHC